MKSEKEILERIEHIKTLSNGYGINERRIKELEWVLKASKLRQDADISWVAVSERLPLVDGNKQLFVWDGYQYEIARFNEWGFHYGTRNTQDCLSNVVFWAECPEPPCL